MTTLLIELVLAVAALLMVVLAIVFTLQREADYAQQLFDEMQEAYEEDMRVRTLLREADSLLEESHALRAMSQARREAETHAADDGETQEMP